MEPFSVQCQYIEGLKWVGCKVLLNEETVFHPCFQPAQLQCIGVNVTDHCFHSASFDNL